MSKLPINVLTLPKKGEERITRFANDCLLRQGANFKIRYGFDTPEIPFTGCSMGHKNIVIEALINNEEMVCIAEDDCVFSDKGAYDYFLSKMPPSFDMYFGEIHDFPAKEGGRVGDFSGLTLYVVHNRFYRHYLTANNNNHLDRALGSMAKDFEFYVCQPFVCRQANGFSFMKDRHVGLDYLYKGKEFFKAKS